MPSGERVREIDTPSGLARAHVSSPQARRTPPSSPCGLVVLGHGAGGGIDAPDLIAVTTALVGAGWSVARVEQPYRVKGHRAPEPAPKLDAAWIAVVTALRRRRHLPLVLGGRSSGARVACRTAQTLGASAVIALAFPLHPPGKPEKSRAGELLGVAERTLVVQGDRDPFGTAAEFPAASTVLTVSGDHSLRQGSRAAAEGIVTWLAGIGLSVAALDPL